MAAAGLYMDSGGLHMANCFPARSLFRTPNRGAGHWLIAQRDEQKFQPVICSASSEQDRRFNSRNITRRSKSGPSRVPAGGPQRVLDTVFLMETHHLKKPSDLCAVDVSDRNLTAARAEEFGQFTCVAYMNAAENMLDLESFRTFPALRELDLSMNGIGRISVSAGDFPQLEVLNLSYNSLSPRYIAQMGVLPRLRVLYLSGNGLTHLPVDLSASPQSVAGITGFPCLEILMLDDNKLSHPAVFGSLAGLKSLRVLNLDKNAISAVPYLYHSPSRGDEPPTGGAGGSGHRTPEVEGRGRAEDPSELAEDKLDYIVLPNGEDTDRTEVIFQSTDSRTKSEPLPKPLDTTTSFSFLPSFLLSSTEQLPDVASPPLPNLSTLSLADNKIQHEDDLLAVALFPSLQELVIHSNPLTTLRKGDPPLLENFLQQRLGIQIIRKKTTRHHKPHLIIPVKEKRKVRTHVPKIPKQPLMLEPPLHPFLRLPLHESDVMETVMSSTPLPPIRTSSAEACDAPAEQSHESVSSSETSEREMSFGSDPTVESVFMTQVDSLDPVHNPSPPTTSEEPAPASDAEREILERSQGYVEPDPASAEHREIPERFRGYEELFDVKTDPDFIEPVGIQSNVRALEYALSHLLVYRDYKPRLDSIQKPHIPRKSKFGRESCRIPQKKTKEEVLSEIVRNMRERRHLMEVSLDSALRKEKSSKERKEAKLLLKELHRKYTLFHAEAVKRAAELETSLRLSAQELLEAQNYLGHIQRRAVQ